MQRRGLLALSSILVFGLLIAVLASSGASAAAGCASHTLNGSYGGAVSASLFSGGTEVGDAAALVHLTFDGQGGLVDTETFSINGQTASTTATGAYTVKANCTGTMTIHNSNGQTDDLNIVVVDSGRQIAFVDTDPGVVLAGTFTKQ